MIEKQSQRFENKIRDQVTKQVNDILVLTIDEYQQLLGYTFQSVEEMESAKHVLFNDKIDNRLFLRNIKIEVEHLEYFYLFQNQQFRLQICVFEKKNLILNGFYQYKTNKFSIDIQRVAGAKSSSHNTRIIRLSKVIYQQTTANRIREKKERKYKTTEWDVRGHWREYKNGKRVWIKPYKKSVRHQEKEQETQESKNTRPTIYKLK